jgi:hypothetical protein
MWWNDKIYIKYKHLLSHNNAQYIKLGKQKQKIYNNKKELLPILLLKMSFYP